MSAKEQVRLVYRGGADLTFRDEHGMRVKVMHGEEFVVEAGVAKLLLVDPAVKDVAAEEAAAAEAEPAEDEEPSAGAVTLGGLPESAKVQG